jgi:RHS repeat-associated protein
LGIIVPKEAAVGQTVAVRVSSSPTAASDGLTYLYSDHPSAMLRTSLGSASAMSDANGNLVGTVTRYYPFGGVRTGEVGGPNNVTDMGFTGHKHNDDLGLIYMNARFYVPGIGRFASADTIVPNPANPQAFNRYSYVINNPLRLIDPSGHIYYEPSCDCMVDDGNPTHLYQSNLDRAFTRGHDGVLTGNFADNSIVQTGANVPQILTPGEINTGITIASFVPGVGEVVDAFDIVGALAEGEWDRAIVIVILAAAPGRASAELDMGVSGLRRLGLSDDLS